MRVPLHFAVIPEAEVKAACARYSISYETWLRQEKAFGLMRNVYRKRAEIRGQDPVCTIATVRDDPQFEAVNDGVYGLEDVAERYVP